VKTSPTHSSPSTYQVIIDREPFSTTAKSPSAAISKCAFKYATIHRENVGLVQWKIKEGRLAVEVKIDN